MYEKYSRYAYYLHNIESLFHVATPFLAMTDDDVDCRSPLAKTTKTLVLVVDGQRSWPSL